MRAIISRNHRTASGAGTTEQVEPDHAGPGLHRRSSLPLLLAVSLLGHAIPARASVGPDGSYRTSIPIEVPPYHGLEPKLALSYVSGGPNGFVGVGWTLSGLSSVKRASAGMGVPNFDATDIHLLDGQQLIRCADIPAGVAPPPGCTNPSSTFSSLEPFTTRIESFRRIGREKDSAGNTTGWRVWDQQGTRYDYTQAVYGANSEPQYIESWLLSRATDVSGNSVSYEYACPEFNGMRPCLLDRISYNGVAIKFIAQERPDWQTTALGGGLAYTGKRLKTIDITLGGTQRVRAYTLEYTRSKTTGRSVLTTVKQYGIDADVNQTSGLISSGASLPATTFTVASDGVVVADVGSLARKEDRRATWSHTQNPYGENIQTHMLPSCEKAGLNWIAADVNGDGVDDKVYARGPCMEGGGSRFRAFSTLISTAQPAPYDRQIYVHDDRELFRGFWFDTDKFDMEFLTGDYNGDGLADILVVGKVSTHWRDENGNDDVDPDTHMYTSDTYAVFIVAISKGDGRFEYRKSNKLYFDIPFDSSSRVEGVSIDFSATMSMGDRKSVV